MAQSKRYMACVLLALAGISWAESRKEHQPHLCSGFFMGPQPQNPCGYLCYTYEGVYQGVLPDGARCRIPSFFGRSGRCYSGECIVQRPKIRQCDDIYRGSGYATSCRYRCVDPFGQLVIRPYRPGTPCLNLNQKKRPLGAAGVCKAGECIEYDDLEVRSRWVAENVFQYKYHRCLAKKRVANNYLADCHHYCRRNKAWYFGMYQDGIKCLSPDTRAPGFCCHGACQPMDCKRKK